MLAAEGGHAHVVEKILDNDQCHFDVDAQDVCLSIYTDNIIVTKPLYYSFTMVLTCFLQSTGKTALFYASERGHLDVVELLLEHKADATIQDNVSRPLAQV